MKIFLRKSFNLKSEILQIEGMSEIPARSFLSYGCISRDTFLRELNVIKPNCFCYYVQNKGF